MKYTATRKGFLALLAAFLIATLVAGLCLILPISPAAYADGETEAPIIYVGKDGEAETYSSLSAAIEAAADGDIVTLNSDVTCGAAITVSKSITLDIGNYTITNELQNNRLFTVAAGVSLTVNAKDGGMTIPEDNEYSWGFFILKANSSLTLNGGAYCGNTDDAAIVRIEDNAGSQKVTLYNVTAETNYRIVSGTSSGAQLTVEGGTYTQNNYDAIVNYGQGDYSVPAFYLGYVTATFNGATITSDIGACVEVANNSDITFEGENNFTVTQENTVNSYNGTAIAVDLGGKATVEGGIYTASYGAYIFTSSGTLIINGGTFNGTSAAVKVDSVDSNSYPDSTDPSITITGGTFNGNFTIAESAECTVTGGIFSTDVSKYIDTDSGYQSYALTDDDSNTTYVILTAGNDTYDDSTKYAAVICGEEGYKGYATLQEAIQAVPKDGATVKLLADISVTKNDVGFGISAYITIDNKSVTLDLNGHKIEAVDDEVQTIFFVYAQGSFTVKDSSADESGAIIGKKFAIYGVAGSYPLSLSVEGGTISATGIAIAASGNPGTTVPVNISGGTITGEIALVSYGPSVTLNLTGGEFTGNVELTSGTLNITDDNVVIKGNIIVGPDNDGNTTNFDSSVNISNGTITGDVVLSNANDESKAITAAISGGSIGGGVAATGVTNADGETAGFITGGTFTNLPNYTYFAEGLLAELDEDSGLYVVGVTDKVAVVVTESGYTGYTTLTEAIAEAKAGDTVTLINDIVSANVITINKAITLDLNGKTVIFGDETAAPDKGFNVTASGTVTIQNGSVVLSSAAATRAVIYVNNASAALVLDGVNVTAKYSGTTAIGAIYGVNVISGTSLEVKDSIITVNSEGGNTSRSYGIAVGNTNTNTNTSTTLTFFDKVDIKNTDIVVDTYSGMQRYAYGVYYNVTSGSTLSIDTVSVQRMIAKTTPTYYGIYVQIGSKVDATINNVVIGSSTRNHGFKEGIYFGGATGHTKISGADTKVYATSDAIYWQNYNATSENSSLEVTEGFYSGSVASSLEKIIVGGVFASTTAVRQSHFADGKILLYSAEKQAYEVVDYDLSKVTVKTSTDDTDPYELYYASFEDVLAVLAASSGSLKTAIVLIKDLEINIALKGTSNSGPITYTIDLNGHTLKSAITGDSLVYLKLIDNATEENKGAFYGTLNLNGTLYLGYMDTRTEQVYCGGVRVMNDITRSSNYTTYIYDSTVEGNVTTYGDTTIINSEITKDFTFAPTGNSEFKMTDSAIDGNLTTSGAKTYLYGSTVTGTVAVNNETNENAAIYVYDSEKNLANVTDYIVKNSKTGLYYTSLQAAINAAEDGETVMLMQDIALASAVIVGNDTTAQNITLDLNGKSLTRGEGNTTSFLIGVVSDSALTVKDSEGSGLIYSSNFTVTDESEKETTYAGFGILTNGSLTVESGTIQGYYAVYASDSPSVIINGGTITGYFVGLNLFNSIVTMNGGTIKSDDYYGVIMTTGSTDACSELTVNGGIIEGGNTGIEINANKASLSENETVETKESYEATVTVSGTAKIKGDYGITLWGKGAVLNVESGEIEAKYFAICGNGTEGTQYHHGGTVINITGGNITSAEATGIYHPQNGELSVSGGCITGTTGIEIRSGSLEITGGTITATGDPFDSEANGGGTTTIGAAVAIVQHTTKNAIDVSITGGSFNGVRALYEENLQNNSDDDVKQINIDVTGGSFEGDVVVKNYDLVNNAAGNGFINGGLYTSQPDEDYIGEGFAAVYDTTLGMYYIPKADELNLLYNAQADVKLYAAALGLVWNNLKAQSTNEDGEEVYVYADFMTAFAQIMLAKSESSIAAAKLNAMAELDSIINKLVTAKAAAIETIEAAAAEQKDENGNTLAEVVVPTATYSAINNATTIAEIESYVANAKAEIENLRTSLAQAAKDTEYLAGLIEEIKTALGAKYDEETGALLSTNITEILDLLGKPANSDTVETIWALIQQTEKNIEKTIGDELDTLETTISHLTVALGIVENTTTGEYYSSVLANTQSSIEKISTLLGNATEDETNFKSIAQMISETQSDIGKVYEYLQETFGETATDLTDTLNKINTIYTALGITIKENEDGTTTVDSTIDKITEIQTLLTEITVTDEDGTEKVITIVDLINAVRGDITTLEDNIDEQLGSISTDLGILKQILGATYKQDENGKDTEECYSSVLDGLQKDVTDIQSLLGSLDGTDYESIIDMITTLNGKVISAIQNIPDALSTKFATELSKINAIYEALGIEYDEKEEEYVSSAVSAINEIKGALEGASGLNAIVSKVGVACDKIDDVYDYLTETIEGYLDEISGYVDSLEDSFSALSSVLGIEYDDESEKYVSSAVKAINDIKGLLGDTSELDAIVEILNGENGLAAINGAISDVQRYLKETIEEAIEGLQGEIGDVKTDVASLQTALGNDYADLLLKIGGVQSTLNSAIEDLSGDLSDDYEAIIQKIAEVKNALGELGDKIGITIEIEMTKTTAKESIVTWLAEYLDGILGKGATANAGGVTAVGFQLTANEVGSDDIYSKLTEAFSETNAKLILNYYNEAIATIDAATSSDEINLAVSTFKTQVAMVEVMEQNSAGVDYHMTVALMAAVGALVFVTLVLVICLLIVKGKRKNEAEKQTLKFRDKDGFYEIS